MGSDHPQSGLTADSPDGLPLRFGTDRDAPGSGAPESDPFAFAELDDEDFFGGAFDVDGEEPAGDSPDSSPVGPDDPSDLNLDALAATFCDVAGIYLRPLQHFCCELSEGPVATSRIAPLLPSLTTVIESARGMGLVPLAERFASLQGYFEAIQQSGAPQVDGTSREAVLQVADSLSETLPGSIGGCGDDSPRDAVALRTLLQQLPAVTTQIQDQLCGVGFTSVEMLAGAQPGELAAITGLATHLCEVCVGHAGEYLAERKQRLHLATPAEWLPVLEPKLGDLERLQRAIDQSKDEGDEERRRLRRERQRVVLQMELLLAEMGRGALVEELQRQRLERRLDRLREFMAELRRPSREELAQRLNTGQSLQHLDLKDQHLEGVQLPNADLAGSDLTGANLAGARLTGARLIHACLREAFLQGADLGGAQLRHAHLEGADLAHAKLAGADLSRACLEATRLEGADLEGARLRRVTATDASFAKACLVGADLSGADLSGADAGGADLRGADLSGSVVQGANLRGADLRGARLAGCELSTARLEGARLEGESGLGEDVAAAEEEVLVSEPTCAPESAPRSAGDVLQAVNDAVTGLPVDSQEAPVAELPEDVGEPDSESTDSGDLSPVPVEGPVIAPVEEPEAPAPAETATDDVPGPELLSTPDLGEPGDEPEDEQENEPCAGDLESPVVAAPTVPERQVAPAALPDPEPPAEPTPAVGAVPDQEPAPAVVEFPRSDSPANERRTRRKRGLLVGMAAAAVLVLAVSATLLRTGGDPTVAETGQPELATPGGVETVASKVVPPLVEAGDSVPEPAKPVEPAAVAAAAKPVVRPTPAKATEASAVKRPPEAKPAAVAGAPAAAKTGKTPGETPVKAGPVKVAEAAPAAKAAPRKLAKAEEKKPAPGSARRGSDAAPVTVAKAKPAPKPPAKKAAASGQKKAPPAKPQKASSAAPVKVAKATPPAVKPAKANPAPKPKRKIPAKVAAVTPPVAPAPAPAAVEVAAEKPADAPSPAFSVAFLDANLETCVRTALGRPGGTLSAEDVAGLTELNCSTPSAGQEDVVRLEGIESLVGLVTLDLSSNQVVDIRPLARLRELKTLNLRANRITDIGPVVGLPNDCEIDLWQNPIADITPLLARSKR